MIKMFESLKNNRRTQIIAISIAVLCFASLGYVVWVNYHTTETSSTNKTNRSKNNSTHNSKNTNSTTTNSPTTNPNTAARQLDGLIVAKTDANKVPACVMIENAAFSGVRPQSGVSAAQVVYEVIVEGGITRWMAVFAGEHSNEVGPVRSARDTYLEFASEYNCAYFHAGGSFTAMQAIRNFGLRDVDGLIESKWFWRDAGRTAPHNLFTSTDNMYKAISEGHSWIDAPTYTSWKFVNDNDIPNGPTATEVNIGFGGDYDAKWIYNATNKNYERSTGGVSHIDKVTGQPLTARNIIIEHVPAGDYIEGKGRINFSVTGTGPVEIIHNGVVTTGFWKKDNRLARTYFVNGAGEELPVARGNSWIELVPDGYSATWQ